MEHYIPITEAIRRLGKSDRQVRRMAHDGKLRYRYTPERRMEIALSDIDKLTSRPLATADAERLDRLERDLAALREELDALSTRVEGLASIPQGKNPQKSIVVPITGDGTPGEPLPDDYTPIYDLIKAHGLTRQRNAIMRYMRKYGYLKTGHWNVGGHEVRNCLDQAGVKEFMEAFVTQA